MPTILGRPIDPNFSTNPLILILTAVAGVIAGIVTLVMGGDFLAAVRAGLVMGAGVFFTWALARELDPDHDLSAFVGVPFTALILIIVPNSVDVLGMLVLLQLARLVSRIVGGDPTLVDSAAILVVAAVAMIFNTPWVLALGVALAFVLDARLVGGSPTQYGFAGGAVILAVVFYLVKNLSPAPIPLWQWLILLAIMVGYGIFILRTTEFRSLPDRGAPYELNPARVRAAMGLVLLTGLLLLIVGGVNEVTYYLPLWAAMGGIAMYHAVGWRG